MKKVWKSIFLLIVVAMVFSLVACGKSESQEKNTNSSSAKEETITLTFWHAWSSETNPSRSAIDKALKGWNEKHPNIKIKVDTVENESYKTKIKTAIAANEAPDIFFTWGAGFLQPFVEAGRILEINEYLNDGTRDKLSPGALNYFTYDEKTYALPFGSWVASLYCNKELFENNGIKMPDTYDELLEAVKAFREKGITPITLGEKERWPGMFFQNILAIRTGGVDLSNKALNGQASFDQPAFVESAARLKELVDAGAFADGNLGLSEEEAETDFMQGKAAMIYMGNWFNGKLESEGSPLKGKVVAKPFPIIEGGKGDANGFLGGSIDAFAVNANTKYKEEAVAALKYLAENHNKFNYEDGGFFPVWEFEDAVDESKINSVTLSIADSLKDSTGYVLAWDTFLEPAEADVHKNLVQELFAGNITPEEFTKEMQKLNENK